MPVPLKTSVGGIIATLPSLTKPELRAIQAAIESELLRGVEIDKDLFYLVFEVTGEKPISLSKFYSSENGRIWRENQPAFDQLITKIMQGGAAHTVIMLALKKFLLQILVDDINIRGIPLTLRTICYQLGNIKSAFERSFPNYLKNDLGHLIMSQLGGRHE